VLNDISGEIQITAVKDDVSKEIFELIGKLTKESVIYIKGNIKESKQAPWRKRGDSKRTCFIK